MTIVSPEASKGTFRSRRKRKNQDQGNTNDTKVTEDGPSESKKLQSSLEIEKSSVILEDKLNNAMQTIKQKYGSEVAEDIMKTLNGAVLVKEEEIKSTTVSTDSCANQTDMMKCMQMFAQIMQNNKNMNPVSAAVTLPNSEFVMRSKYNNDGDEDDDNNSVITTMESLKVPSVDLVSSNNQFSANNLQNIDKKESIKFVPIKPRKNEEKSQSYESYSSPRSVTISNPFLAASKVLPPSSTKPIIMMQKPPLLVSSSLEVEENKIICDNEFVKIIDRNNNSKINGVSNSKENLADEIVITACSDLAINSIANDTVTSQTKLAEEGDKIIPTCCDIVTSISNDVSMSYLQNNDNEVSSSFLEFCDEMISNHASSADEDEGKKSPVYEPIATSEKHTVDISQNESTAKDVFSLNANSNNANYLNTLSIINPFESLVRSSSWDNEIAELQARLQNELPVSDVLLNDFNFSQGFGMTSFGYTDSVTSNISFPMTSNNSTKEHGSWYRNCVVNPSLQDEDGDTILHIAIIKEDPRALDLLPLLKPADLKVCNNKGQTPLHLACYLHQTEMIRALLRGGADDTIVDKNGNNILHIACEEESFSMVQSILLSIPRQSGRLEVMLNRHNNNGWTPLHVAVKRREHNIVKYLVDYGCCDLNIQDEKSGSTVLIYALMHGDRDLIRFLIEKGADVNIPTQSGLHALNFAAQIGDIELVKDLIERDASINGSKLPAFPASHPNAIEMKTVFENELRKRRRKKMKSIGKKSKGSK